MRRPLVALVSLSISLLAAGIALRVVYGPRPLLKLVHGQRPLLKVVSTKRALFESLRRREGEVGHPLEGPDLLRIPLDELTAAAFFPANGKQAYYQYDPIAYSRPVPNLAPAFTRFDEHPAGGFYLHVNGLGLREEHEVALEKRDLRVLVSGDSHTYGLCATAETFPNVLEGLVADGFPERQVEVLNGGGGYYHFYNYLGTFERLSGLAPDVFVLVAYGGNDFSGSMVLQRYFHARGPPATAPYRGLSSELPPGAGPQETNQAVYFLNNPEDELPAVQMAVAVVREIHRQCLELGIELLVVYLPSAFRGQPELYAETIRRCIEILGVDPEALAAGDRIADRWLAALCEAGIRTFDLRPAFRSAVEPMFWKTDLHLNVAGHRLVAQQLLEQITPLLAAHPNARARAR